MTGPREARAIAANPTAKPRAKRPGITPGVSPGITPGVARAAVAGEVARLRRELAGRSLTAFCRLYLPERFSLPMARMHTAALAQLEWAVRCRSARLALAAPPEHGKTTMVVGMCLWALAIQRLPHIIVAASDDDAALEMITEFGLEVGGNEPLLRDFPHLAAKNSGGGNEIITAGGQRLASVAVGERLLGRRRIGPKPELLVCDDAEKPKLLDYWHGAKREGVSAEEFRGWLDAAIAKRLGAGAGVAVVGSIPADDALLADLVDPDRDFEWVKRTFPAVIRGVGGTNHWETFDRIVSDYKDTTGHGFGEKAARRYYEVNKAEMAGATNIAWPERFDACALRLIEREVARQSRIDNPFASRYQCRPVRINPYHAGPPWRGAPGAAGGADAQPPRVPDDWPHKHLEWRPCGDEFDATTFIVEEDSEAGIRWSFASEPGHVPEPGDRRAPAIYFVGLRAATGERFVAEPYAGRRRIALGPLIEKYWKHIRGECASLGPG